jgi:hypothetical protein
MGGHPAVPESSGTEHYIRDMRGGGVEVRAGRSAWATTAVRIFSHRGGDLFQFTRNRRRLI